MKISLVEKNQIDKVMAKDWLRRSIVVESEHILLLSRLFEVYKECGGLLPRRSFYSTIRKIVSDKNNGFDTVEVVRLKEGVALLNVNPVFALSRIEPTTSGQREEPSRAV